MVDQVQERLVMAQRVAQRKRVIRAQSLLDSNPLSDFVDRRQQSVELHRREEVLEQNEATLLEILVLLVCLDQCHGGGA